MSKTRKPWHEVVALRDDLKTGELSLAIFAADLYDVIMQRGNRPIYERPEEFFALTYPTYNLRELVKDVAYRLAGKSDKACHSLSVNYGGGKTHTLIALCHLVQNLSGVESLPAVQEFTAHVGFEPPKARVVALCFDKIDLEIGVETIAPDGASRVLKYPWSILAWQLAGAAGLKAIHKDGKDEERESPPAEPLLTALLKKPQQDGLSTLVLLDEVLMYVRGWAETRRPQSELTESEPSLGGQLTHFFQHLTQAVVKADRCALVASLLASDPSQHDRLGKALLAELTNVFGRLMEESASPVSREDVAEVLRRRFFQPDSIRDPDAFRPQVTAVVKNVAGLHEDTRKAGGAAEERYLKSFPFHPELTEAFYARWTQVEGFQRTRGILRTFAIALRDAEKWDQSPIIGANVFLNAPGKRQLAEATRELCLVANTEDSEGQPQQWEPILEGELDKARTIETEASGLGHREVEQAVIAVFLHSQPIGHKALTQELMALLAATQPDKIELEKALWAWTERSWFLDEAEIGTAAVGPDGTRQLPKSWRLGNRPNLRQMHDEACRNRVSSELVERQLINAVERLKSLTEGASAAGATTHNLPDKPGDVGDDGEFRYVVLGLQAASESGKPSAEAKRFIEQTTTSDRPRANRNAIVLAVPSKDGLEMARTQVRDYLGWVEVRNQLKDQAIDSMRAQKLAAELDEARRRIPKAIREAWCMVVTVAEDNSIQAFRITPTSDPLFNTIKADTRTRIQEGAINSEAIMPGGPYDLWRENESSRPVKDLVDAFARSPKLPKMLRRKGILDTLVQGVQEGILVARLERPDKSVRTFWRSDVDDVALGDLGLEVWLPEKVTLTELPPELLAYEQLPGLWPLEEISLESVIGYFAGGLTVAVRREGYEDTAVIPKCESGVVEDAVKAAIEQGKLWLTNGPASVFRERVPDGVLAPTATLAPPPGPIHIADLMEGTIPDAWEDKATNAFAILTALSARLGKNLPWPIVRSAINEAISANWLRLAEPSVPWPWDIARAQQVVLRVPEGVGEPRSKRLLVAEAELDAAGIQELADQVSKLLQQTIGRDLRFHLRIELEVGDTPLDEDGLKQLNALLAQVSEDLQLCQLWQSSLNLREGDSPSYTD